MWIYSKPRSEHDNRFLLNLDLSSRINLSQLGERWFIEVMQGTESHPIASTTSSEEATELLNRIFEGLNSGEHALDLQSDFESAGSGKAEEPASDKPSSSPLSL